MIPKTMRHSINLQVNAGWHRLVWPRAYKHPAVVELWLIPQDKTAPRIFVVLQDNGDGGKDALLALTHPIQSIELIVTSHSYFDDCPEIVVEHLSKWDRFKLYAHKFNTLRNQYGAINAVKLAVAKLQQLYSGANFEIATNRYSDDFETLYYEWQKIYENNPLLKNDNVKPKQTILAFARDKIDTSSLPTHSEIEIIHTPIPNHNAMQFCRDALARTQANAFIILPEHGQFHTGALEAMVEKCRTTHCAAVYTDHDIISEKGERHTPHFKPCWSPIRFEECDYIGKAVMFAPSALDGLSDGVMMRTHAILKALSYTGAYIAHIPVIGFHATNPIEPSSHHTPAPPLLTKVEIIIPTRDNPKCLKPCIESILKHSNTHQFHITIINNNSKTPKTLALLKHYAQHPNIRILDDPSPFNFATLNNKARKLTKADVLVFLNDDTEVLTPNWLDELAHLALMPNTGAIGAMLLYPNGTIQHAGIAVGIRGSTGHIHRHQSPELHTPLHDLQTRREVSAVTGACLAISAENFDLAGGFDAKFPIEFNDVDLCLKLNALGKQTVWTPHVKLTHYESTTRGVTHDARSLARFQKRWMHMIENDPFYNANLTRASEHGGLRV